MVMALTDTGGAPPSMAAPTPTPTPAPTPPPTARGSSLATLPPQPTLTHAPTIPHAPEPEADDTPDVEIVPAPPKPAVELIDITDDRPDISGGSLDVHGEVAGNLNVESVGDTTVESRFHASAPPRLPSHPSLLLTLREHVGHLTGRPYSANSTARQSQHLRRTTSRQASEAGTATASSYEPERRPTVAQQRAQWGHIEVPLRFRDWHTEANQQYAKEMANKRRRTGGGSYHSNSHGTVASASQVRRTGELEAGRPPRAPAVALAEAPRRSPFEFVTCSTENAGQLCSTPGCNRPRRHHRINADSFISEPVCCPSCSAPLTGSTPVTEHVHSEACNLREADRTRQRSLAPSPTHVSKHATSVARVSDGSAGGSARSHNDD